METADEDTAMDKRDVRFLAAVLGDAPDSIQAFMSTGDFGTPRAENRMFRWPDTGREASVFRASMGNVDTLVLTRVEGGGLEAPELGVGFDLRLDDVDPARVFGVSPHLLGHLHAPETARATKGTVQVAFVEDNPAAAYPSFGLVKVRARLLWQAGGRHVLRIVREMPVGWPEGGHHERDEAALTRRTGHCGDGVRIHFGLPYLTPERTLWRTAGVEGLHEIADVLGA